MTELILYKTKHKATLFYAKTLARKTGAELKRIDDINTEELKYYSTIIFGTSISFGKFDIAQFILDYWGILQEKRIVLFSVTSHKHYAEYYAEIYQKSLPIKIISELHYFPLYGVMPYDELNFYEKTLFYLTPRRDTLGVFEVDEDQLLGILTLLKKPKGKHFIDKFLS